ncbi:conserved hypothetical protein [Verticillium alfalfae VaMs.102]|uniref:Uncharacterized protein n=1 Tax=Verticillium alfalfae (strain VaMs.102 / ATCC MYA-4576 / FGSC 10136) TaxID=526221 RepID=C9SX56_VERA1|nr:conserved hypothetical protein [Verticillium alfalfae VaMs.102]EEY23246.1 conserved hypothetical protein [Verticillium alfalfae VaMs.102]
MAWLRGIRVSIVPIRRHSDGTRAVHEQNKRERSLPEFPHPDSCSVRLMGTDTTEPFLNHSPSTTQLSSDNNYCIQRKVHPRISIYVPSEPGTQFAVDWVVDRVPASSSHVYFVLLLNGRRMVSWGTDGSKLNANTGTVEYGLFEPSSRWRSLEQGVELKLDGVEKRYFYFSANTIGTSVATNGGLLEVQAFRSMGRQRQAPRPGEYRDQVDYGITLKELNLIPWSERHASTDLLFRGGKSDISGEVESTNSDKDRFNFSLSATQKALCFDNGNTARDMSLLPQKWLDGASQELRASHTLDICEEFPPVVAHQYTLPPYKTSQSPVDLYLQRPLPILPPPESHSRKSSGGVKSFVDRLITITLTFDDYNTVGQR